MKEKRYFFNLMGYIILAGAILIAAVFCIDPFYHYHDAWFGLPVILDNAVYQTAGAARNLSYDSAIIGTSMTENFHTAWFDGEMGWDTVKLSYSGARTSDLKAILEQVFGREEPPENIVMDVNDFQLTVPAWTAYVERPAYLYDGCVLTDVSYVFNYDVLVQSLERVKDKIEGRESNIDSAYTWEEAELFGKQAALGAARANREAALQAEAVPVDPEMMLQVCDENLDNVIPFIEGHPETEFYIFYPPYSMLYWELKKINGTLEEILAVYEHSMKRLLPYDNVKIYYFQAEAEIISDLDNYRDETHYRPEYNRYIFECMRDGKNLVTEENLRSYVEDMYRFAESFDYDSLWKEFLP